MVNSLNETVEFEQWSMEVVTAFDLVSNVNEVRCVL